jgi:hypothetical protein
MGNHGLFAWLFSEAGAGWVFGVVSLIGLVLTLLSRKRPQRIICRELHKTSLVHVSDSAKAKIAVSFDDRPVEKLSQLELVIFNDGSEVVEDILLTFQFQESTKVLAVDYEVTPRNVDMTITPRYAESGGNQCNVEINFLNPQRPHKQQVKAYIVCDGTVDHARVAGGGKGWSLRFDMLEEYSVRRMRIASLWMLLSTTSVVLLVTMPGMDKLRSPVSLALVALALAGVVGVAVPYYRDRLYLEESKGL